jgi:hypothetical protein
VRCTAQVETLGRTGVEMEALTAVQVGLLTIYDMCKAADRGHGDGGHPRAGKERRQVGALAGAEPFRGAFDAGASAARPASRRGLAGSSHWNGSLTAGALGATGQAAKKSSASVLPNSRRRAAT